MNDILNILLVSMLNIVCFFVGAKIGQKVNKGEDLCIKGPIERIKEHNSQKEYEKIQQRIKIVEDNIDAYDGTSNNQQQIGG